MRRKNSETQPAKRARELREPFTKAMFREKALTLLNEVDEHIANYSCNDATQEWIDKTRNFLTHSLGDDAAQTVDFANISYCPPIWGSETNDTVFAQFYNDGLKCARRLLKEYADEVEEYFVDLQGENQRIAMGLFGAIPSGKTVQSKNVFIVHGHDGELVAQVENAVRCLGLMPVVLSKQPNAGMTLIQKFEANSNDVCFAIFLLTDDEDVVVRSTGKKEKHPRQNVVFEMGYFFNAFRRGNGSHCGVFAILENGVTKPGDVDGLVYHLYAKGDVSWKLALVKELCAAHVDFDKDGISKL